MIIEKAYHPKETQGVLCPRRILITPKGCQQHAIPYLPNMPKKRDGIMTVRIPTDEKDLLQAIADKADVTLSDAVVRAVRDFIESHPVKAGAKKRS
jgi:hypothetical protein